MNEATFGKLAEYSINDTPGSRRRAGLASHATHLLFEILGFSLFVCSFTRSHFGAQAEWLDLRNGLQLCR
jgi:hypothetical protein